MKLIACDLCFISDVKMIDTFVNKPSFVFILLFQFKHRIFYLCKSTLLQKKQLKLINNFANVYLLIIPNYFNTKRFYSHTIFSLFFVHWINYTW